MATELTAPELWQPFEPGVDGQWDLVAAAHLFRRAGFGATRQQLEVAVRKSPLQVIDELLDGQEPPEYRSEMQTLATAAISGGSVAPPVSVVGLSNSQHPAAIARKDSGVLAWSLRHWC